MRDAAGEAPDRFHLGRLAQARLEARALGLGELPFGDVAQIDDHGGDARLVQQVGRRHLHPAPRTVAVLEELLAGRGLPRDPQMLVTHGAKRGALLGVDELEELPATHVVGAVARHAFESRAGVEDAALPRPSEHERVGAALDHGAKALLVGLQRALAPLQTPGRKRHQRQHRDRGEEGALGSEARFAQPHLRD